MKNGVASGHCAFDRLRIAQVTHYTIRSQSFNVPGIAIRSHQKT
jgi:hypothetical protein